MNLEHYRNNCHSSLSYIVKAGPEVRRYAGWRVCSEEINKASVFVKKNVPSRSHGWSHWLRRDRDGHAAAVAAAAA